MPAINISQSIQIKKMEKKEAMHNMELLIVASHTTYAMHGVHF